MARQIGISIPSQVNRNITLRQRRVITAYGFLIPAFVFFIVFYFYPIGLEFWISLQKGQALLGESRFVGLENYLHAFQDPRAIHSFVITVIFSLGNAVLSVVLGMGLAMLLNQKLKGRVPIRAILFFPYMTTFVIVGLMWRNILDPYVGILNSVLMNFGLPTQDWLANYDKALNALIFITIWHTIGYYMVLFLAGLQGIPTEFMEAARIDGANSWQGFRLITLPLLAPTTLFVSVISVVNSLQAFAQAYIITMGGPADATRLFTFHIFNVAFTEQNFSYASALSFIMLIFILIITAIQLRLGRSDVEY